MYLFIVLFFLLAVMAFPVIMALRGKLTVKRARRTLAVNLCGFFTVCLLAVLLPLGGIGSAEKADGAEAPAAAAQTGKTNPDSAAAGLGYLAAAIATGASALGAGIAVAAGSSAAIGATSEDPKMLSKALIFVAMGEGVALYGLIIAFMILGKIG